MSRGKRVATIPGRIVHADFVKVVQDAFGIRIGAESEDEGVIVQGHISSIAKHAGHPFRTVHGEMLLMGEKTIAHAFATEGKDASLYGLRGEVREAKAFASEEPDATWLLVRFIVDEDTCPYCDVDIPRADAHDCSEVILYDAHEAPDRMHKSHLKPHGLKPAQLEHLRKIARDYKP